MTVAQSFPLGAVATSVAPLLSVVVPCFNEAEGLEELHRRLSLAACGATDDSFEIILVDDGSRDQTWNVISGLAEADSRIVAVKLSRNHGHQLALTAGLSFVRGEVVFVIDADLQDPPELLDAMLKVMRSESADVVYGQRRSRAGETHFKKKTASAFYRLLARATDINIPIDTGDFRLISRRVAELLAGMPEHDRFVRGMIAWLGFKQVAFVYDRDKRSAGSTKYPLARMLRFAVDAFLGHSMVLLRIAGLFAIGLLLVLFLLALYVAYSWMFRSVVPGWTFLTMLIIVIGAGQLLVLSILGEYIGRIYIEGKRRPLFIVEAIKRSTPRKP